MVDACQRPGKLVITPVCLLPLHDAASCVMLRAHSLDLAKYVMVGCGGVV